MLITGERTVPGVEHENYWYHRHLAVYEYALTHVPGLDVLEAGSGEGYGASLLATEARSLVALDYDAYATQHAHRAYPGLPLVRGNLVSLPFAQAWADVVVSLQTIEHLWDQTRFVTECLRVLRPGGLLVLSTPNRLTFPAGNLYHTREFSASDLRLHVGQQAPVTSLLGLHHAGSLRVWESAHGSLVDAQLAAEPDRWDAQVRCRVSAVTTADFRLRADHLDDSLDLVLLAHRPA